MKKQVLLILFAFTVIAVGGVTLAASAPYGVVAQEGSERAECTSRSGEERLYGRNLLCR